MADRPRAVKRWSGFIVGAIAILVAALLLARAVGNEYFFFAGYVVLQFIVLATAWNILGGYAGYVNFGSGAFFAAGAYTAVALIKAFAAPLLVQLVAAAMVTGLMGFAIGAMTLRLRGIFFSIATVAIAVICETIVLNWGFVGGARGATVLQPPAPAFFASYTRMLFVVMTVLARAGGRAGALHRDFVDRPRIARDPRQRGSRRIRRRSHPETETLRRDGFRRADGHRGRSVSALHELHRAHFGIQPQLRGVRACHADHRRHRELGRPGDRRSAAGFRAADRHRDHVLGTQRAGPGAAAGARSSWPRPKASSDSRAGCPERQVPGDRSPARGRGSHQAFRRLCRALGSESDRALRASASASSGPTARARPRSSTASADRSPATAARSASTASTFPGLLAYRRTRLGIARSFQVPRPFSSMTLAENVAVPLEYVAHRRSLHGADVYAEARSILAQMGLADKADAHDRQPDAGGFAQAGTGARDGGPPAPVDPGRSNGRACPPSKWTKCSTSFSA